MEKGYYCCVYVMIQFKREFGVDSKEEQAEVEEEMGDVNLDNER